MRTTNDDQNGIITATSASVWARPESRLIQSATGKPISRQQEGRAEAEDEAPHDRVDVQLDR